MITINRYVVLESYEKYYEKEKGRLYNMKEVIYRKTVPKNKYINLKLGH